MKKSNQNGPMIFVCVFLRNVSQAYIEFIHFRKFIASLFGFDCCRPLNVCFSPVFISVLTTLLRQKRIIF